MPETACEQEAAKVPDQVSPLILFRNQTFRSLWISALASNFGGLVQAVGAAWLMTSLSDSQNMVALVQGSVALPIMIFSLLAGVFADNFDRRRVMLVAQAFMFCVSIILTFMAFEGWLSPWLLLGFTFLIGCGTALHNPSWQATMGDIVSREELPSAVSLNSMGFNLMRSVGPAAGGAIVAIAGAAAAFAVNALSYVAIILALLRWQAPARDTHLPREPMGSAFAAGLRYVAMSPNLLRVILRGFWFGLSAIALLALLPVVVRETLNATAFVYGVMLGCFGMGAVAGALSNASLRTRFRNEIIARGGFVGFGASCLVLAFSTNTILSGAALMLAGAAWVLALSMFNVTIQLSTPRWVVGRVIALYQTGTFGGMAAGSLIWGAIAEQSGSAEMALLGAAGLLAVGALIGYPLPLPEFNGLDLGPLNRFKEPATRFDLNYRSGPVMVMVDYEIAQEDVPEFLAAMSLRRRVRIRDGAQQWALLRDLHQPEHWSESYHVPTWGEYVRHNERRTNADAALSDRLRVLHRGEGSPAVHRMIERQTVPLRDDMMQKEEENLSEV
ncbi:MFS transporter [Sulfitobacter pseudonitzschiae]|uniref:MFS transporter n=1 Tax=Pseudosulfitobacter pseudonitzschiae TaxID=1402135 RepID=A0A9Q2NGZ7_9RHOB|nr:MFS transporter [Pseudosulfitobacter pseudonitzschiae]MBM2291595.1 MFS transporter [Pseudosulfitobacter pseudonitzschiae]MBM2296513.1 MFS transporter [Pseudosulfitobacter pseudonitzschiae]MBM2301426.1 MFS transporter [Pseudosulfitobacter pseudonitzschiae]MBM2311210.1 MFS transporter [Pseudosulfitobacter pseudonitzschiae]MBM2316123.1 MFS transporter [Pseudosulfitobacter pseudonitzschiae]